MIKLPDHTRPVIGIDPGISGAVVRLVGGRLSGVSRDFKGFADIAAGIRGLYQPGDRIIIENVHAMPGEGVCSVWTFGKATGVAHGVALALSGEAPQEVAPQRWQNAFRLLLGIDKKTRFKEVTREVATRLFPDEWELFQRKKDHGTSDAALIAAWGVLTA